MVTKKRIQEIRDSPNYSKKASDLVEKAREEIDEENRKSSEKLKRMLN